MSNKTRNIIDIVLVLFVIFSIAFLTQSGSRETSWMDTADEQLAAVNLASGGQRLPDEHYVSISKTWTENNHSINRSNTWPPNHSYSISKDWPESHGVTISGEWLPDHTYFVSSGWEKNQHKFTRSVTWPPNHSYSVSSEEWPKSHRFVESRTWPPDHTYSISSDWEKNRHDGRRSKTWPANHAYSISKDWPKEHFRNVSKTWPPNHTILQSSSQSGSYVISPPPASNQTWPAGYICYPSAEGIPLTPTPILPTKRTTPSSSAPTPAQAPINNSVSAGAAD